MFPENEESLQFGYRNIEINNSYLQFEDKPGFDEVEPIANTFMGSLCDRKN